jgi:hypothetical protein
MEVILDLLEFLVIDREGIADVTRDGIFLGEMADCVNRIANLLVLMTELIE